MLAPLLARLFPLLALSVRQDVADLRVGVAHQLAHVLMLLLRRERRVVVNGLHLLIAFSEDGAKLLLLGICQIEPLRHMLQLLVRVGHVPVVASCWCRCVGGWRLRLRASRKCRQH
jgi:hypothetical protein